MTDSEFWLVTQTLDPSNATPVGASKEYGEPARTATSARVLALTTVTELLDGLATKMFAPATPRPVGWWKPNAAPEIVPTNAPVRSAISVIDPAPLRTNRSWPYGARATGSAKWYFGRRMVRTCFSPAWLNSVTEFPVPFVTNRSVPALVIAVGWPNLNRLAEIVVM